MRQILKQSVGIDVAQKELVVTIGRAFTDLSIELYAYKVFKNTDKDIVGLLDWVLKETDSTSELLFVMEATGVYHQKLAYYLSDKSYHLSVILPNKISNYMRTLEVNTVTDKTDSRAICQFGLERNLVYWRRPKKVYRTLQQLTRERSQIVSERVIVKKEFQHKELYKRLVGKSGIKMKGLVAVQRKLLELIYVIHKNKTVFNENYEQEKRASQLKIVDAL